MLRWSVFTSERRRLKVTLLVLLFVQALMFEAWQPPLASASTISPYPDWLCNARIASLYFEPDIVSLDDLRLEVDNLASQGVSVVELDSGLSYYDWFGIDDRFQRNLDMIGQIASYIHAKQLKVVVYVAALEMISKDWRAQHTFFKDHPNWVQVSIKGEPMAYHGISQEQVSWLSSENEDAWASPFTPYRQFIKDRIERIIRSGSDGIWLDVPFLQSYITDRYSALWADHSTPAREAFQSETGLQTPTEVDWDDATWRRWIAWRHRAVMEFVFDLASVVQSAGGILTMETSTADKGEATYQANDASYLLRDKSTFLVMEVDPKDEFGMRDATPNDWLSFFAMLKYSASVSGKKPFWVLNYGYERTDATAQLGLILATSGSYFETRVSAMTGTVGLEYRKQANEFVKAHTEILNSRSVARVAVLYSRGSRDFIDRGAGEGYDQSEAPYLKVYRSTLAVLTKSHVQFDILILEEADLDSIAAYEVLVAPGLGVVSDQSHRLLASFPGLVLVVGSYGTMNEYGDPRVSKLQLGKSLETTVEDLPQRLGSYMSKVKASERLIIEEKIVDARRLIFILNPFAVKEEVRIEDGEWDLISFGLPGRVVISPAGFEAPRYFAILVEKKPASTMTTTKTLTFSQTTSAATTAESTTETKVEETRGLETSTLIVAIILAVAAIGAVAFLRPRVHVRH